MKILFYFGHPAQYLFARQTIKDLISNNHEIKIVIKTKDVLEKLLQNDGMKYENILTKERGKSKISIIWSLIKRTISLFPIVFKFKPDILVGEDATIAHIGFILRINRITILEDDYDIIKEFARITYPFSETILCPNVCSVGVWENKKIGYEGYMKMSYLHPKVFQYDNKILEKYKLNKKYALIRLAKLTAFHDFGIIGISIDTLDKIISILDENNYQVYLSIEGKIDKKYHKYILNINPSHIHHVLSQSSILISDSQSMSVEASILGVPSLRVSTFVGKISVLEELEHRYHLTFGIDPSDIKGLFVKLNELLSQEDLKAEFKRKKLIMLKDKINVSFFLIWFIENYPKSKEIMKKDPSYQQRFK